MCRCRTNLRALFLTFLSLTRNPNSSQLDAILVWIEPCFTFCEKLFLIVGPLCVLIVIIGVSFVLFTMYVYMVPILQNSNPIVFFFEVIYGHWLLINVVFHYYKGVTTPPGSPEPRKAIDDTLLEDGWTVCKKCDQQRPIRAHHCRLCRRCILKMDHHCPWLNNCVGHNNHRYFMLFIIYIWLGVSFVICTTGNYVLSLLAGTRSFAHWLLAETPLKFILMLTTYNPELHTTTGREITMVMVLFFICFGVWIGLSILGGWHFYLISRAETSIEWNDNRIISLEYSRKGKKFTNPHNYGFRNNWKLFLGLVHNRSFWRHVLLPSGHSPVGNGINWRLGYMIKASEPMELRFNTKEMGTDSSNGKVVPV